ncbi:hypothetical protein Hanom_Chr09g00777981 [Helianthus anomalus]
MQLDLAISVSSGSAEAHEPDAETAQIKAAKQRSLGCSPSESLLEFLSLRYWFCMFALIEFQIKYY